jgi:hypothetical protein
VIEVVTNALDGEANEDAEYVEKFDAVGEDEVEGDHVPLEVVEMVDDAVVVPVIDGELVIEIVTDEVSVFELVAEIVFVAEGVYVPEPVCEIVPVAHGDDVGDIEKDELELWVTEFVDETVPDVDPIDADAVEVTHELDENVGETVLVCEDVSDKVPDADDEEHTDAEVVEEVEAATEGEIFAVVVPVIDVDALVDIDCVTDSHWEEDDVVV